MRLGGFEMSSLVSCKACSKEIAKGVKKCPNCGKDQRNWFMRHKVLSFIGVIVLFIVVGSMLGGGDETAESNDSAAANTEEKVYAVNEVVATDKVDFTVTVVEERDVIGDPSFLGKTASEGAVLVAIQHTMKNTSDEPLGMFSIPTISLVDSKGTKYSTDLDASSAYAVETDVDDSKVLSDLNPGITVTGTDVFEIAQEQFASGEWFIVIDKKRIKIK